MNRRELLTRLLGALAAVPCLKWLGEPCTQTPEQRWYHASLQHVRLIRDGAILPIEYPTLVQALTDARSGDTIFIPAGHKEFLAFDDVP